MDPSGALGPSAMPMPYGDDISAIQTGMMDGTRNILPT